LLFIFLFLGFWGCQWLRPFFSKKLSTLRASFILSGASKIRANHGDAEKTAAPDEARGA